MGHAGMRALPGYVLVVCACGNRDYVGHESRQDPECSAECGRRMRPATAEEVEHDEGEARQVRAEMDEFWSRELGLIRRAASEAAAPYTNRPR